MKKRIEKGKRPLRCQRREQRRIHKIEAAREVDGEIAPGKKIASLIETRI